MTTCVVVPLGPACVDITGVRAGDLNLMEVTLTDGGVAIDLTGQTLTAQARKTKQAIDALDAVIDIHTPLAGKFSMRWPGDDVRTLLDTNDAWSGVWDLQVSNGVDDPVTVIAGKFKAEMDVTRA